MFDVILGMSQCVCAFDNPVCNFTQMLGIGKRNATQNTELLLNINIIISLLVENEMCQSEIVYSTELKPELSYKLVEHFLAYYMDSHMRVNSIWTDKWIKFYCVDMELNRL